MATRTKKGQPAAPAETLAERRAKIGRVVARIARELQGYRDSLGRAVGVCNGYDPTEEPERFSHRIKSITGKVKAARKSNRALMISLQELDNLASE